jgi:PBSX family phage terminase large subunit
MPKINSVPKGTKNAISIYGGCEEFLYAKDPQIFLYGGTGSGKTTAACLKMAMLCTKYPGVKFLFTRKSYRALVKSGVETFEKVVQLLGLSIGKRPDQIRRHGDAEPREFSFPFLRNTVDGKTYQGRSRILLSSLDRVYDEMGSEYDYIYVNQPEEITEDDWQFLITRATGRRGVAPYVQMFGDPNPSHERHWIRMGGYEVVNDQKVGYGDRWRLIKSVYTDNPVMYDQEKKELTDSGKKQMAILEQSLNPTMARRLIQGEWCSAEGLVYGDVWRPEVHNSTVARFNLAYTGNKDISPITNDWKRFWAIDFGFDHPFVCAFFAKHPTRELYVRYKLIYMSNRTVNEHAEVIRREMQGEPLPVLVVADKNPGEIMVLSQALGLHIVAAAKGPGSIQTRTDVVTNMLKNNELLFLDDALVEEDPRMIAKKKPIGFENEVDNLRWDTTKTTKEVRIDGDDHEENAIGYLFSHIKANERVVPFIWV